MERRREEKRRAAKLTCWFAVAKLASKVSLLASATLTPNPRLNP